MRINCSIRRGESADEADAGGRFLDAKGKAFVFARKSVWVTACMLLLVAWSTRSDAQWARPAAVSDAAVHRGSPTFMHGSHASRDAVDSRGPDSADGVPRGAIGAVVGGVIGGLLGYRWELGLCEKPAAQCTGTRGAIGGAVIGAAVGWVLDWAISGPHHSTSPTAARDKITSAAPRALDGQ